MIETFSMGPYLFFKGGTGEAMLLHDAVATTVQPFAFVNVDDALTLIPRLKVELMRGGCTHVLGAHAYEVWSYDLADDDFKDDEPLSLLHDDGANFSDPSYQGYWFVIKNLTPPFEITSITVDDHVFDFAVIRGGFSFDRDWITTELNKLGYKTDFRLGLKFMFAVDESNEPAADVYWMELKKKHGPLSYIVGIDSDARHYFDGMPQLGIDLDHRTFFLDTVLESLDDAVCGYLIPISKIHRDH